MKLSHLSTVSALALMLAVAPAAAQQTTEQPADEPALGTTQPADEPELGTTQPADEATVGETTTGTAEAPATTAQDVGMERMSIAELDELMNEIGIEDTELFAGQVVVTRTEDGQPIVVVLGPQDFEHGEVALDAEAFPELRDQMTEAGFQDVREDHAWQLLQGTINGHHVLAASGDPDWGVGLAERPADDGVAERAIGEPEGDLADQELDPAQPQTAQPQTGQPQTGQPQTGMAEPADDTARPGVDTAEPRDDLAERDIGTEPGAAEFGIGEPMADFDRDRIDETIGQLDIEDRGEFQGKVVRARTDEGQRIKLLVGTEGFAADEEIELSEDELRERLEDAGLTDVQVVDQDIAMYRGNYNDMSALIIGGRGFADDPMQTGARQQPTGTGIDQQD